MTKEERELIYMEMIKTTDFDKFNALIHNYNVDKEDYLMWGIEKGYISYEAIGNNSFRISNV